MPPGHERNVVYTYRYLRAAMIALLLMLVFSVGYQWWWETARTCWLGSISAYYYTPARTIFVGSLCALGACLIAYKGHSPAEDVLLNFSGFMAFVVAMVPTAPDGLCGPNAYSQTLTEIGFAVRNNIWSLIFVTALATVIAGLLRRRTSADDTHTKPTRLTIVVSVACGVVLLVELTLFLLLRPRFVAVSHGVAAITMVAGVIAVMVCSALRAEERHDAVGGENNIPGSWSPRTYRAIYLLIAGILLVTLVVAVAVAWLTNFDHLILWVELAVIVLFGVYWSVQTRELWNLREPTIAVVVANPGTARSANDERAPDAPDSPLPNAVLEAEVEGRKVHTVAE
jgi:hypothetical protein